MLEHFLFFRFLSSCHFYCGLQVCYLWKMLLDLRFVLFDSTHWLWLQSNFINDFFYSFLLFFLITSLVADIWYTCKTDWNIGKNKFYHTGVHSDPFTVWNPIFQASLFLSGRFSLPLVYSFHLKCKWVFRKIFGCILYHWGISWQ